MAVGGGLYVGTSFAKGEVYNLPIAEVRSRLMSLSLSPDTLAIAGGSNDASVAVDSTSDSIVWSVPTGGDRAARFIANLRAEGPSRTRVIITYVNGSSAPGYADRLTSTRFFRSYAETNFNEDVDARLDGRPVDKRKARRDFATRAAADPRQLRELGLASASAFNEIQAQATADGSEESAQSGQTTPRAPVAVPEKN